MIVKLLTEHHLEFLRLKGRCRGSSESTLVKMSNCWKSHAAAHKYNLIYYVLWKPIFDHSRYGHACIMHIGAVIFRKINYIYE